MKMNQVVHGDMLEVVKKLDDGVAQSVIVDPPYNIGKDFGNDSDKQQMDDYLNWCDEWMNECYRVLADNGTMFVYGFSEILALILARVPLHINRRWIIWHYTNKNAAHLKFWQRSHESILVLWKKDKVFNRDLVREPYTDTFLNNAAGKKRVGTPSRFGSGVETVYNAHKNGALPRDVIKIPALAGGAGSVERVFYCKTCSSLKKGSKEKKPCIADKHDLIIHPTQKPMELSLKLLESCKQSDGLVFVPFAGTGSECLAALQLGLPFVGADLNADYVKLTQARLDDWKQNGDTPRPTKNKATPKPLKNDKKYATLGSFEDFSKLTVNELKTRLKLAGKPISGKKVDLIARLEE